MILVKKGAHRNEIDVSSRNWQEWTGLDPKSRDLAIRGLTKKGFFVSGRGDKAKFRFDLRAWEAFYRTTEKKSRPHVQQKRTPAKPGQMIHPECREQGCFLARQTEQNNLISIDVARPTAALESASIAEQLGSGPYPVIEESLPLLDLGTGSAVSIGTSAAVGRAATNQETLCQTTNLKNSKMTKKSTSATTRTKKSTISATSAEPISATAKNTTPTALIGKTTKTNKGGDPKSDRGRISRGGTSTTENILTPASASPDAWPLTFTVMTKRFPAIDSDFLARLIRIVPSGATDEEVAGAVKAATVPNQKTAGLWLTTVPATLANLRREAKKLELQQLRSALTEARRALGEAERVKDREWYEETKTEIERIENQIHSCR